jgi:hypothetical protein
MESGTISVMPVIFVLLFLLVAWEILRPQPVRNSQPTVVVVPVAGVSSGVSPLGLLILLALAVSVLALLTNQDLTEIIVALR